MDLLPYIRDFPDFPKPGILFKDISPILASPAAMQEICLMIVNHFADQKIDLIAGAESRGLIFASLLTAHLGAGMIMIRKKGKLPGPTIELAYDLEYGSATLEIQKDAIKPRQQVLLIDDLLATGGTASTAEELVKKANGVVVGHAFIIELLSLNGREKLKTKNVFSAIQLN